MQGTPTKAPSSTSSRKLLALFPETALTRNSCCNSSISLTSGYRPGPLEIGTGPNYRTRKGIARTRHGREGYEPVETLENTGAILPGYSVTGTVRPANNPHLAAIELYLEAPLPYSSSPLLASVAPSDHRYQQGDYVNGTIIVRPKDDIIVDSIVITAESSRMQRNSQPPLALYSVMDQVFPTDRVLLTGFEYIFSVSFLLELPPDSSNQIFLRTALTRIKTLDMSPHARLRISTLTALRLIQNCHIGLYSYESVVNGTAYDESNSSTISDNNFGRRFRHEQNSGNRRGNGYEGTSRRNFLRMLLRD